jgi:hypothetical protein
MYEWTPGVLSEFLVALEAEAIQLPDFTLDRSTFLGEVFIMAGAADVVFSERIHRAIAGSYENALLAVFDEGHRFQKNRDYYLDLRRAFFRDGLESASFKTLFSNPRNRNAESTFPSGR